MLQKVFSKTSIKYYSRTSFFCWVDGSKVQRSWARRQKSSHCWNIMQKYRYTACKEALSSAQLFIKSAHPMGSQRRAPRLRCQALEWTFLRILHQAMETFFRLSLRIAFNFSIIRQEPFS